MRNRKTHSITLNTHHSEFLFDNLFDFLEESGSERDRMTEPIEYVQSYSRNDRQLYNIRCVQSRGVAI